MSLTSSLSPKEEENKLFSNTSNTSTKPIKESKKDRHMKLTHQLTKYLEDWNEKVSQRVLIINRDLREALEEYEKVIDKFFFEIDREDFLVQKEETDLDMIYATLLEHLKIRLNFILTAESDLELIEKQRQEDVIAYMKDLINKMISIGYKLAEDIEKFIENEVHDLNTEIISNKIEYNKKISNEKITTIIYDEKKVKLFKKIKVKWRNIKHNHMIKLFFDDIYSEKFTNPSDRIKLLSNYRDTQINNFNKLVNNIKKLKEINYHNISKEKLSNISSEFNDYNVNELNSIQSLYNNLTTYYNNLDHLKKERRERLRQELHLYGALKVPPNFSKYISHFEALLNDENLANLWRLGGGLKSDILLIINDLGNKDIIYNYVIKNIKEKLELIILSYPVKNILKEKGKEILLDKIKNLIIKLRSSPRNEMNTVVSSLVSELTILMEAKEIDPEFTKLIEEIIKEMTEESKDLEKRIILSSKTINTTTMPTTALSKTSNGNSTHTLLSKTTETSSLAKTKTKKNVTIKESGSTLSGTSNATLPSPPILTYINPSLLKIWHRKLGILFYSSEFSEETQELTKELLGQVNEQLECNNLINTLISKLTKKLYIKLNLKYKKLINNIVNFLEYQLNFIYIQLNNIIGFFFLLNKKIVIHNSKLNKIDNKNYDELWDLKEESEYKLSNFEKNLTNLCKMLTKSTSKEEINENFQLILDELNKIIGEYREFFNLSCYVCDKFPVNLFEEFITFFYDINYIFSSKIHDEHGIIKDYSFYYDQFIRLNSKLFEDENSNEVQNKYFIKKIDFKFFSDRINDVETKVLNNFNQLNNDIREQKLKEREKHVDYFITSSYKDKDDENNSESKSKEDSYYTGRYKPVRTITEICSLYEIENRYKVPDDEEVLATTTTSDKQEEEDIDIVNIENEVKENQDESKPSETTETKENVEIIRREDCIYLKAKDEVPKAPETTTSPNKPKVGFTIEEETDGDILEDNSPLEEEEFKLISYEDYSNLKELDREDYDENLYKYFIPLSEEAPPQIDPKAAAAAAKGKGKGKDLTPAPAPTPLFSVHSLSPESLALYRDNLPLYEKIKQKKDEEKLPEYMRYNPPLDFYNSPWVLVLEISNELLGEVYLTVRNNFFSNIEYFSYKKINDIINEMKTKKTDLTEELEERIRKHWPRRGYIETEIKQPREAELLGHKEKTYRFILSIQNKMIDLQGQFEQQLQHCQDICKNYKSSMINMEELLNGNFKNLSILQGYEVKARGLTLEFINEFNNNAKTLKNLLVKDTQNIINYSKDFRKICPLQEFDEEGNIVQSGYSESEIQEIENFVTKQVAEIEEISVVWQNNYDELLKIYDITNLSADSFTEKYNKVVQAVSIAEGLGQKYGAPRRRAQEKIRTEVSRDEKNANEVDELIAKIEFLASEIHFIENEISSLKKLNFSSPKDIISHDYAAALPISSSAASANYDIDNKIFNLSADCLKKMNYGWLLMKKLHECVKKRVEFLQVLNLQHNEQGLLLKKYTIDNFKWFNYNNILQLIEDCNSTSIKAGSNKYLINNNPLTTDQINEYIFPEKIKVEDESALPNLNETYSTLDSVFEEVNKQCRLETRNLYEAEGLMALLEGKSVPESLEQWLAETKEKLLGRHGYHEKAWKRLWNQLQKIDDFFLRYRDLSLNHNGALDLPPREAGVSRLEHKLSSSIEFSLVNSKVTCIQKSCIGFYADACISLAKIIFYNNKNEFYNLFLVFNRAREKHERLLRPQLGSPDKVNELNQLNNKEIQRSNDYKNSIYLLRSEILRYQFLKFRNFVGCVVKMTDNMMRLIDSIYRQEVLMLPPDTVVTKKHKSLKKLRKLQKNKKALNEVTKVVSDKGGKKDKKSKDKEANAEEAQPDVNPDRLLERVWPSISFPKDLIQKVLEANSLVNNLGQDPRDFHAKIQIEGDFEAENEVEQVSNPKDKKKDKSDKKSKKEDKEEDNNVNPSLLTKNWIDLIESKTSVIGYVSSSQRILIEERDNSILRYLQYLSTLIDYVQSHYDALLKQEDSWTDRWNQQVNMLKEGTF